MKNAARPGPAADSMAARTSPAAGASSPTSTTVAPSTASRWAISAWSSPTIATLPVRSRAIPGGYVGAPADDITAIRLVCTLDP